MSEQAFMDGKRTESVLPLRTLLYGEGVFETFRYKSDLPVFFLNHYQRMKRGAELLRIPVPEISVLSKHVRDAVEKTGYTDAYVKACLLSQGSTRFYDYAEKEIILVIVREYSAGKEPVKTLVHSVKRYSGSRLLQIKSMNYLENIAARRGATEKGFDEALFLNDRDEITEGSASNVFWFKDGEIFTPSLDCGVLPGITRSVLLNNISELGIKVREGGYFLSDIINSEFACFTNSITGCSLISRINECSISVDHRQYGELKKLLFDKLKWS